MAIKYLGTDNLPEYCNSGELVEICSNAGLSQLANIYDRKRRVLAKIATQPRPERQTTCA